MNLRSRIALPILLGSALSVNAAPGGSLAHEPLRCVPIAGNARVTAVWKGAGQVTAARVYFRASGTKDESFLELRRASDSSGFWAVLPVPGEGVEAIRYRLVLKDADGREAVAGPVDALVTGSCPVVALSQDERAYAKNLVIGQTGASQSAVPGGFSCAGMVAVISAGGDMRALPPCTEVLASKRASVEGEKPASRAVTPMRLDNPPLVIGGQASVSGTIPTPAPTQPPISPARPKPN